MNKSGSEKIIVETEKQKLLCKVSTTTVSFLGKICKLVIIPCPCHLGSLAPY